jgi:hypothetical protein
MNQYSTILNLMTVDECLAVFYDLDHFTECMQNKGWHRYWPNPLTGYLTEATVDLLHDFHACHIWGMNENEGTEEALIVFFHPYHQVIPRLESIRKKVFEIAQDCKADTTLSIGTALGIIHDLKPILHHQNRAFRKDPVLYMAFKALRTAKKRGGNQIIQF